ncbi:MAG: hypothetical protein ISR72_10765 [Methylobacter sp.]|nr:hypothetical protein [Methylobacter sp.]
MVAKLTVAVMVAQKTIVQKSIVQSIVQARVAKKASSQPLSQKNRVFGSIKSNASQA